LLGGKTPGWAGDPQGGDEADPVAIAALTAEFIRTVTDTSAPAVIAVPIVAWP